MPKGARIKSGDQPSRRQSARQVVHAPVDVTVLRSGVPDTVPGRVVDLGTGGIAVVLARELLPGESVGVEIELPDSSRLRVRALVRNHDRLRCGMEFVGLLADQKAVIQRFLKGSNSELEVPLRPLERTIREVKAGVPEKAALGGGATKSGGSNAVGAPDRGSRYGGPRSGESKIGGPQTRASQQPAPRTSRPSASTSRVRGWVFLIGSLGILLWVLWWRWDRGWQDLESGLHPVVGVQPETQVSADAMQGLVTHRVDPEYPEAARAANLQGVVVLDVIIGPDGSVRTVKAVNGPEIFRQPAADALRWWRFQPYQIKGHPAAIETTVAVEFKP
jgi:TonB family protein